MKSDPPEISEALLGISDKLLVHNRHVVPQHPFDFFSDLDFDIVHTSHASALDSEIGLRTEVKAYFYHTDFSRPPQERRVVFHLDHHELDGTRWSISFPVQIVMNGYPWFKDTYVGYSHGIVPDGNQDSNSVQYNYVGITMRDWLKRMAEHFAEIRNGSNKLFHSAWRQYLGNHKAHLVSELITTNHTFEQIMAWEEWAVDREMAKKSSLNMIPGGFKGMKFLHEHRLLNTNRVTVEEREQAITRYQMENPRLGVPNLLVSNCWKNPEYAEKVICGAEGRLNPEQVREIRRLNAAGYSITAILREVGARTETQVARVIDGLTYTRIL